jgi:hypothetical protein
MAGETAEATMLTAAEVGRLLGVSARKVYDIPPEHLPRYQYGPRGAVRYAETDVREYKLRCRSTETKRLVAGALSLTSAFPAAAESALESAFRKRGIEPRLTPSTGRKRQGSTPSPQARNGLQLVSSKP